MSVRRFSRYFVVGVALALTVGLAQAQTTESSTALADATPQENVGGGRVAARAPGNRVQEAIARHNALQAERLRGAESESSSAPGTGGDTGTGGGELGSGLSDLLGQFGGTLGAGVGGSVESLLNIVGNSTGVTSGSSATGGTAGSSSTSGSRYTIEDLIRLRDTGSLKPNSRAQSIQSQQSAATANSGGALARLGKTAQQAQTLDNGTELKFKHRLIVSWLSTLFTALTFGFSTQDFIDQIADDLRPLIHPTTSDDGDSGDGGSGGSSSGEGIEDVSAAPTPLAPLICSQGGDLAHFCV